MGNSRFLHCSLAALASIHFHQSTVILKVILLNVKNISARRQLCKPIPQFQGYRASCHHTQIPMQQMATLQIKHIH